MIGDTTNDDRKRRRLELAWLELPFCSLCGIDVEFEDREHKEGDKLNPKMAVNRRLYRKVPHHLRKDLSGLKTSIILCLKCNYALDKLIDKRLTENVNGR